MTTSRTVKNPARQNLTRKTSKKRRPRTHKFPVDNASMLLDASRNSMLNPQQLFAMLPMRVYHDIGDIGAGPGYFTIPLAKYAFDGHVYAIDMQQGMLDIVAARLDKARLNNAEILLSKETKIPMDQGALDGAIIVNTLHEATRPKTLLQETCRMLRKGGWVGLIDWRRVESEEGPPINERLEREDVMSMAIDAGFRVQSYYDFNRWFYFILLIK